MKLLVSVVSADEARRALAGGADIIDVKDPREGALGAPSPRVLSEVVTTVGEAAPVSVALGDLPALAHTAALAARGAVACGAPFPAPAASTRACGPPTHGLPTSFTDWRAPLPNAHSH